MSPSELLYVSWTAWWCTTFNRCSYHWPIKRSHSFFQSQFAEQKTKHCISSGSFQHKMQLFFPLVPPFMTSLLSYVQIQKETATVASVPRGLSFITECFGHVMFWKKRRCLVSKHSSGHSANATYVNLLFLKLLERRKGEKERARRKKEEKRKKQWLHS